MMFDESCAGAWLGGEGMSFDDVIPSGVETDGGDEDEIEADGDEIEVDGDEIETGPTTECG